MQYPTSKPIQKPNGGARRDRTDDILLAKQALSQLSYGPVQDPKAKRLSTNNQVYVAERR